MGNWPILSVQKKNLDFLFWAIWGSTTQLLQPTNYIYDCLFSLKSKMYPLIYLFF